MEFEYEDVVDELIIEESQKAREYHRQWRDNRFKEDRAAQLLYESCFNAFGRGKESYQVEAYRNVSCSWTSGKEMYYDLLNHEQFMEQWRKQTEIYIASDYTGGQRPILGRKNDVGDYSLGNIQVEASHDGIKAARGKTCYIIMIRNASMIHCGIYPSINDALIEFGKISSINIPYNAMTKKINSGVIHQTGKDEEGNDWSFILQSRDGTMPEPIGNPRYQCVYNINRYWADLDFIDSMTENEQLDYLSKQNPVQTLQCQFTQEYIWLNANNNSSCTAAVSY